MDRQWLRDLIVKHAQSSIEMDDLLKAVREEASKLGHRYRDETIMRETNTKELRNKLFFTSGPGGMYVIDQKAFADEEKRLKHLSLTHWRA